MSSLPMEMESSASLSLIRLVNQSRNLRTKSEHSSKPYSSRITLGTQISIIWGYSGKKRTNRMYICYIYIMMIYYIL